MATEESYPEDLRYHPEHDWARIEGDEATFGVTWYAQDSLGDVVFFDPPEVGATISKDEPYTEVESVKAVSDVIAPLSGEILAVNDDGGHEPGADQHRSLRQGLDGQGPAQRPRRGRQAARRRRLQGPDRRLTLNRSLAYMLPVQQHPTVRGKRTRSGASLGVIQSGAFPRSDLSPRRPSL